jgi:cytidylate kinase
LKKHIVTIAGRPGSGKSTAAKLVAVDLGFQHFSAGDLLRSIGKEMGLDILQTNLTAEENAELDRRVDQRLRDIGEQDDRQVVDARLAWHWMPTSFKVFLDLDLGMAAERIIGGMGEARLLSEHIPSDPTEYSRILQRRLDSEIRRYRRRYDVDPLDTGNFDIVVDTKFNNIEQTSAVIVNGFQSWLGVTIG